MGEVFLIFLKEEKVFFLEKIKVGYGLVRRRVWFNVINLFEEWLEFFLKRMWEEGCEMFKDVFNGLG